MTTSNAEGPRDSGVFLSPEYRDEVNENAALRTYIAELELAVNHMGDLVDKMSKQVNKARRYVHPSALSSLEQNNAILRGQFNGMRARIIQARKKLNYVRD